MPDHSVSEIEATFKRIDALRAFARLSWQRFAEIGCMRMAASLSYTSLLALVPVAAICFAILAVFPMFEEMRYEVLIYMVDNFVPETSYALTDQLIGFINNARGMTEFGIIGLAVVAIMLINTIFSGFNAIFKVIRRRPVWKRALIYLGVLILGPVVVVGSFSLATYIMALTRVYEVEAFTGLFGRLARLGPALIVMIGFAFAYKMIPSRPVRWSYAFIGALVAGLLFSGLRWGFGLYLVYFPTYKAIYGTLSALPVFLTWMYLSWAVILLGAVVTAALCDLKGHLMQLTEAKASPSAPSSA